MNLEFWLARASRTGHSAVPGDPSEDDLQVYAGYAEDLLRAQTISGKPGLILGATRPIVDWCKNQALNIAVMDFCMPLAQRLQSNHQDWDGVHIIVDDWLTTTQRDNSFCWAAGDGVINAVGSGRNAVQLLRQISRLLEPGSVVILRHMVRPTPTPGVGEILERVAAGRIRTLGGLKHRVAQALQGSFMDGIMMCRVRSAILDSSLFRHNPDGHFPWSQEPLSALDYYVIEGASLCYPTLEELQSLTDADFEELSIIYGNYEMSDLCPTISYRLRGRTEEKYSDAEI